MNIAAVLSGATRWGMTAGGLELNVYHVIVRVAE